MCTALKEQIEKKNKKLFLIEVEEFFEYLWISLSSYFHFLCGYQKF